MVLSGIWFLCNLMNACALTREDCPAGYNWRGTPTTTKKMGYVIVNGGTLV